MKKIGIITLVFHNYGTILQSYALCKVLNHIAPTSFDIKVINLKTTWGNVPVSHSRWLLQIVRAYKIKSLLYIFKLFRWKKELKIDKKDRSVETQKRNELFNNLCSQIPYTSQKYSPDELRNGLINDYDALIVGSDQVWNGIKVSDQDVLGLTFFNGKKLTYAASFGMTSIPQNMVAFYKKIVNSFDTLLMRETEGVNICKSLGRNDAEFVLDPTLLLQASDYDSLIEQSEVNINDDYILVYSLNCSYKIYNQAHRLAQKCGCKMIVLKRSFCPPDIGKFRNSDELYAVSPQGFLSLIKNSKCVVTNSYHAMLFSINFKKNFYLYLDNCDEENSRMQTIVRMLNLEECVYWETQRLPKRIKDVSYQDTDEILEKIRQYSINCLKTSLSGV